MKNFLILVFASIGMFGIPYLLQLSQKTFLSFYGVAFVQYSFMISLVPSLLLSILLANYFLKRVIWSNKLLFLFTVIIGMYVWALRSFILVTPEKIYFNDPFSFHSSIIPLNLVDEATLSIETVTDLDYRTYLRPRLDVTTHETTVNIWDTFGQGSYTLQEIEQILDYFERSGIRVSITAASDEQQLLMQKSLKEEYTLFL